MGIRKIKNAKRVGDSTFVTLDCSHQRSFGGHVYKGRVQTPVQLTGQDYDCKEGHCYSSK